ncbi:MAG: GumC family protein [Verrucomicrobiia bacterium]
MPPSPELNSSLDYPDVQTMEPGQDLRSILLFIREKSWIIALCIAISIIGAAIYLKSAPRIYEATATVQVEQEEQKIVKVEQVIQEDLKSQEVLNTIVQKFKSRQLLERVLESNKMFTAVGTIPPGSDKPITREDILNKFADNVKTTLRRQTRLIDISVQDEDPKLAAQLANSLVDQYVELDAQLRSSTTKGAYEFLKDESERLKNKLEESEKKLQEYRQQVGSVSFQQSQDIVIPQLRDLSTRLTQAKADTIKMRAIYEEAKRLGSNITALLAEPNVSSDPQVQDAIANLVKLQNEFTLAQLRYKSKHPKYIQSSNSLEEFKRVYTNAVLTAAARYQKSCLLAYESAKTVEDGLELLLKESESNALQLADQAIQFNLLSREVEADRALFDSVLNRLKETSITTEITPEKIRLIQPAVPPELPASPKVKMVLLLSVLLGGMLGMFIGFGIDALDVSVKTVEQAETNFGLPVLAAVPKIKEANKVSGHIVATEGAPSTGAETFRTLRTSVLMSGKENENKIFLVTSALPEEGKTFTSINFAASLAQQGFRTLLIDADLRRPSVTEYIIGSNEELPGLTDYLLGKKSLSEVAIKHSSVQNFEWMPDGSHVPNPTELLAQEDLIRLFEEASLKYDKIVIDSAPVHVASDTLLLANKVHSTILVVKGGKTPVKAIARSIQALKNAGARINGIVLNMLPVRRGKGYYYYDYYYHGYYSDYYKKEKKGKETKSA